MGKNSLPPPVTRTANLKSPSYPGASNNNQEWAPHQPIGTSSVRICATMTLSPCHNNGLASLAPLQGCGASLWESERRKRRPPLGTPPSGSGSKASIIQLALGRRQIRLQSHRPPEHQFRMNCIVRPSRPKCWPVTRRSHWPVIRRPSGLSGGNWGQFGRTRAWWEWQSGWAEAGEGPSGLSGQGGGLDRKAKG